MLFRHGIAEVRGPDGTDATRRLTDEGVEKTRLAAAGLRRVAERPDVILTSPLVRAAQTAAILGEVFDRDPVVMDELAAGPAARVIGALSDCRESVVMLVGHEPTLGRIVEAICTLDAPPPFVDMKKAGCACVVVERNGAAFGRGILQWLATPSILRALASP